jgi:Zn-dependent protease with chaperone function
MKILPRLVLLSLLLLVAPLESYAQTPDYSGLREPAKFAWVNVSLDPAGPVKVELWVTPKVENRAELERSLLQSFSFPLQITDAVPLHGGDEFEDWEVNEYSDRWTRITAEHPKPLEGKGFNCVIDPRPLGAALESHQIEQLKIIVQADTTDHQLLINGSPWPAGSHVQVLDIDLRSPVYYGMSIKSGYDLRDILKITVPLVGFLFLPMFLTILMSRSARKFYDRPAELWGRHMRFLNRVISGVWLVWLCIYSLSGMSGVLRFAIRSESVAQFVNVLFYFAPPALAMFLCHLASRGVYRVVTGVSWSPAEVVRRAMLVNTLSLGPLFILVLVLGTFGTSLRQGVIYALVGSFGWILLTQAFNKNFAPKLHALTSGDLRNRIFELAQRAGVLLKQIYVLPEERAQLSNAFARSDESVMITGSLLKNLSRREVDAIMAHEIGHLQAKHPKQTSVIMLVSVLIVHLVGTMFTLVMRLTTAGSFVFAASIVIGSLIVFFVSRRNERQADAIGISLTGDPEAFISGLAKLSRLNLMPLHASGLAESLETHPSTMKRLKSIARAHQIPDDRFQTIISETSPPPESTYPAIEEAEADSVIFSSDFKKKYSTRYALLVIAMLLLLPLPFAALLEIESVSGMWLLATCAAGLIVSFGIYQVVRNATVFWGNKSLSHALSARLNRRGLGDIAREGTFVGLAPAGHSRKYEGYQFWDIGLLWFTDEKLYYLGEQTEFTLTREQVHDVYVEDLNPEWLPEKSLYIRWQGADGVKETLHLLAVAESSLLKSRHAIAALKERLEMWRYQPHSFPSAQGEIGSIGGPAFPVITSEPAVKRFRPLVIKIALQFAWLGAAIAFAFGLSWLGVGYTAGVVFVWTVLDELPKAFRSRVVTPPQSFDDSKYEPGSWATRPNVE